MSFNKYFHDELTALRELGREFSENNPRLAPFLSVEAQDPDVERLLEGCAFMTGRLKQKLDDELPELTHSLMSLLWPNFLRPIPSMSILQFMPLGSLSETQRIDKGIEVDSNPVDGTACRFRTCYDVDIMPLSLVECEYRSRPKSGDLRLQFSIDMDLSDAKLDELPLYLFGETHVAQALFLWFNRYVDQIDLYLLPENQDKTLIAHLGADALEMMGFAEAHSLLDYTENTFLGFRLIQEYFSLPDKFHFIKIKHLSRAFSLASSTLLGSSSRFELVFNFNRPLDRHVQVDKSNFRLFCTPIVNFFSHDAIPINLDHRRTEYRVLPAAEEPSHYEIYSIDKVRGSGSNNFQRRDYKRFESFEHVSTNDEKQHEIFYRERLKGSVTGIGSETYLSFANHNEVQSLPEAEVISIDLTCTNRNLPSRLSVGDINVATSTSPEYALFENITSVTPTFTPPLDQGLHWRLISNMTLNYISLGSVDTLKMILSTYDYRSYYDRQQALASQQRLDGIEKIITVPIDRLYKGVPVRGVKTILSLRESKFASEGDMYLFAAVLNEFLALYASINSFHQLEVNGVETGEVHQWTARIGKQPLF